MEEKGNNYVLNTKISYSSNKNLDNQKIYLTKKLNFKKIEVFDKSGTLQIRMVFNDIDKKASFNNKYFSTSENMKSAKISDEESSKIKKSTDNSKTSIDSNKTQNSSSANNSDVNTNSTTEEDNTNSNTNENSNDKSANTNNSTKTTSLLDETIYPMYLPTGTYLSTEETVSKEDGERTILTFAGDSPFILVEEAASVADEFETIPVYGEPTILLDSVGALSNNTANFISNGVEYYISGENLTSQDILNVAESINTISVMK